MAEEFRLKHKIMMKLESSAKTGHNVDQIFIMAAKILYNNFKGKIKVLVSPSVIIFRKNNKNTKRKCANDNVKRQVKIDDSVIVEIIFQNNKGSS